MSGEGFGALKMKLLTNYSLRLSRKIKFVINCASGDFFLLRKDIHRNKYIIIIVEEQKANNFNFS